MGSVSAADSNNTTSNYTGLADSPSPEFQTNTNHTGQSEYTGPQTNATKWNVSGNIVGESIGSDGTIYALDTNGIVYSINKNGIINWSNTTITNGCTLNGGVAPAIGNNETIYVAISEALFAFDKYGTQKWNFTPEISTTFTYSSPTIGSDGTIYYVDSTGILYAINPDGTQKWNYTSGVSTRATPVVGPDGTIYFGSTFAVYSNGTLRWSNTTMKGGKCAVGPDGTIYVSGSTSGKGKLYAVTVDGNVKWEVTLTGNIVYSSPAISSNGTIYIGTGVTASGIGYLYAIDSNGTILWNTTLDNKVQSSAVIGADGTIYIQTLWGNFYAINPDGSVKWTTYINGNYNPVIDSNGTLYISGTTVNYATDSYLFAIQDFAANFTASPVVGNNSLSVNFMDLSTGIGDGTSWLWDFGDGSNSTEQNPIHNYTSPGTYTVKLTVTKSSGEVSVYVEPDYITVNDTQPPIMVATPGTGIFNGPLNVTLTPSENATIYYTTNGLIPTENSTKYSGPITLNGSTTIRFIAVDSTGNTSPVYTETYTIDTTSPTASATVKSGVYNRNKVVWLRMSEAGTIYYTTDGSTPTTGSKKYSGAITISKTTKLRFIAIDKAGNKSPVYTYSYTIDKTRPIIKSTTPKNKAGKVSRTGTIIIRFSEKIKASSYWSKIYVKNLKTGKKIRIKKWIKNNVLYIKTSKRTSKTRYRIYIPTSAVKDLVGNKLGKSKTITFKTR